MSGLGDRQAIRPPEKAVPSDVIKHGWLESSRTKLSVIRKITDFYGPFQPAMFDETGWFYLTDMARR